MTLPQLLLFAVTMLILFGGLFYTIWVFHKELSGPAPLKARRPSPDAAGVRK